MVLPHKKLINIYPLDGIYSCPSTTNPMPPLYFRGFQPVVSSKAPSTRVSRSRGRFPYTQLHHYESPDLRYSGVPGAEAQDQAPGQKAQRHDCVIPARDSRLTFQEWTISPQPTNLRASLCVLEKPGEPERPYHLAIAIRDGDK